jgi:hypothetical protein
MGGANTISHRYQDVTIQLISGERLEGHLLGFSPIMTTLHFFERDHGGDVGAARKLDIEDIVYVALHSQPGTSTWTN